MIKIKKIYFLLLFFGNLSFASYIGGGSSSGSGGSPASPDGSIQFNNSGAFGGTSDFTFLDNIGIGPANGPGFTLGTADVGTDTSGNLYLFTLTSGQTIYDNGNLDIAQSLNFSGTDISVTNGNSTGDITIGYSANSSSVSTVVIGDSANVQGAGDESIAIGNSASIGGGNSGKSVVVGSDSTSLGLNNSLFGSTIVSFSDYVSAFGAFNNTMDFYNPDTMYLGGYNSGTDETWLQMDGNGAYFTHFIYDYYGGNVSIETPNRALVSSNGGDVVIDWNEVGSESSADLSFDSSGNGYFKGFISTPFIYDQNTNPTLDSYNKILYGTNGSWALEAQGSDSEITLAEGVNDTYGYPDWHSNERLFFASDGYDTPIDYNMDGYNSGAALSFDPSYNLHASEGLIVHGYILDSSVENLSLDTNNRFGDGPDGITTTMSWSASPYFRALIDYGTDTGGASLLVDAGSVDTYNAGGNLQAAAGGGPSGLGTGAYFTLFGGNSGINAGAYSGGNSQWSAGNSEFSGQGAQIYLNGGGNNAGGSEYDGGNLSITAGSIPFGAGEYPGGTIYLTAGAGEDVATNSHPGASIIIGGGFDTSGGITFWGGSTFNDPVSFLSGIKTPLTANSVVQTDGSSNLTTGAVNLASQVTGSLPVASVTGAAPLASPTFTGVVTLPILENTAAQTTLTGTAGTVLCSQPEQGSSFKKVICYASGFTGTGISADTFTYPTSFSHTPVAVYTGAGITPTISSTTVAFTATLATGYVILEGY